MDVLRAIPIHEKAVRWISAEPLLEDISANINLDGFGWVVCGGESGSGKEYVWDASKPMTYDWNIGGRRTMLLRWAANLRDKTKAAGLPFMFKQVTSERSGVGVNALGRDWHEFPEPYKYSWGPRQAIAARNLYSANEIRNLNAAGQVSKDGITPLQPSIDFRDL